MVGPIHSAPSTRPLQQASASVDQSINRISSGQRLNGAADDAAGIAVSETFSAQTRGQYQAIRNAGDGMSQAQTASSDLSSLVDGTQRIRELAVQSANGIYSDADRELINKEVGSIKEQMNSVLERSNFNGQPLFRGGSDSVYQIGPDSGDTLVIAANNLQDEVAQLGFADVSVNSADQAQNTIALADDLLDRFSATAADLGAVQNRFTARIDTLSQQAESSVASGSRITDADLAKESTNMVQNQIQERVGIALQAQANQSAGNILQLLGR
jgi:flagellin